MNTALAAPPRIVSTPRKTGRALAVMAASGLAGGLVGYAAITLLMRSGVVPPRVGASWTAIEMMSLAVAAVASVFLVIGVHEAGHLLGGRLAGWRPLFLFVGPLKGAFSAQGVRWSFNRVVSTWGGLAACAPPPGPPKRRAFACLVAGGPLASFGLAGVLAGLAALSTGPVAAAAVLVACLSATIGVATLLPARSGGFTTDGGQLLALWRNDPSVNERLVLSALMAQSLGGVRPRDWDAALLAQAATATGDPNTTTVGLMLNALSAMDQVGADAADTHPAVERYAQRLQAGGYAAFPSGFRSSLLLPLVVYLGQTVGDAAAAQAWLDAAAGGTVEPWQRLHAQAAVAWAQGRPDEALQRAQAALQALAQAQDPGAAVAARDALNDLVARCQPAAAG